MTAIWLFVIVAGLVGVAAIQWESKIHSTIVRALMITVAGLALLALAVVELNRLTAGFQHWHKLSAIDAAVPAGWLLAALFVLGYAISTYMASRKPRN